MKLTPNEKKILKILMKNARQSDMNIASEVGISSQAVGKIRRKLEKNLINHYTAILPYDKVGIKTFAISFSKLTKEGLQKDKEEIEKIISRNPHIIELYRLPSVKDAYLLIYAFSDVEEMDSFFNDKENKEVIFNYIENSNIFTLSHSSYLKNDLPELICKKIDNLV